MRYILYLLHIILKFALLSWQVPRSSVGRALYRESGPSQDGDPVPGDFFFSRFFPIFYVILLKMTLLIFPFIPSLKIVIKKNSLKIIGVFLYLSFYFITLQKVVFHLLASLPFSHTLKLRIDIGTLLSFNIIKSSNVAFVVMLS